MVERCHKCGSIRLVLSETKAYNIGRCLDCGYKTAVAKNEHKVNV